MGKIYKISCKCGYSKKVFIGAGLSSCSINTVNRVFSEEKSSEFNNYYNNKEVKSFIVENELSYCKKCNDIMSVEVLKAQLTNHKELVIINDCPTCSNKVQILKNINSCPICNEKLDKDEVGRWD